LFPVLQRLLGHYTNKDIMICAYARFSASSSLLSHSLTHSLLRHSTEILSAVLMFAPTNIRVYILTETKCEMLSAIITAFINATDDGVMEQLCDIIKTIVDSDLESMMQVRVLPGHLHRPCKVVAAIS